MGLASVVQESDTEMQICMKVTGGALGVNAFQGVTKASADPQKSSGARKTFENCPKLRKMARTFYCPNRG